MKATELIAVAIRIFGILLFFVTLRDTPNFLASMETFPLPDGSSKFFYMQYAAIAVSFVASLLMMKFPLTLSRLLFSPSSSDSPLLEERGDAIQLAGITIVGVYVLTWSIPDLIAAAIFLSTLGATNNDTGLLSSQVGVALIVSIVEIGLGLYCALGAKSIVGTIRRLRG